MIRRLFFPLLLLPAILLAACSGQAPQQDVNNAPTDKESESVQVSPPVTTPSEGRTIFEQEPTNDEPGTSVLPPSEIETIPNQQEDEKMVLSINGISLEVQWEENETVVELLAYVQRETITVNTSVYGGFEQVGGLPQSFSRNDVQIATEPGDIVLYSGNQLVVFFESNSWSYTKLGHIEGLSEQELSELLDTDSAVIEIKTN